MPAPELDSENTARILADGPGALIRHLSESFETPARREERSEHRKTCSLILTASLNILICRMLNPRSEANRANVTADTVHTCKSLLHFAVTLWQHAQVWTQRDLLA